MREHHLIPADIPLREEQQDAMPHQPEKHGDHEPAKPHIAQGQEPQKQAHGGPGMPPDAQDAKGGNAFPDTSQHGGGIAMNLGPLRWHYNVPPPTSPSVPSMAVPPPKIRRLRGRSYPRSLASELYVRVSPHTAQAWNNAPRYPVRTSMWDTVSIRFPLWHELVYGSLDVQERGSLSRCFHPSLCGRYGGCASRY